MHLPSRGVLFGGGALALSPWRSSASGSVRRRAAAGATRRRSSSAIARSSRRRDTSGCRRSPATASSSRTSRRAARPPDAPTRWSCRTWASPPRGACSRGRPAFDYIVWSPDRRNLLLGGTVGGRSGLYLVSALGGTPRLLPTGAAGFFAEGDSLSLAGPAGRGGSLWIHVAGSTAPCATASRWRASPRGSLSSRRSPTHRGSSPASRASRTRNSG